MSINSLLIFIDHDALVTNQEDLMKLALFVILFLICAIISGVANASSYDSKVQALYSPALIDSIIKDQIQKHKHSDIRPIDGNIDVIEVQGGEREFMASVAHLNAKEKYTGR